VTVQRHPEFSGDFLINMEGKIQMPFVGDIDIYGLTKKEAEDKLRQMIGRYVVSPDIAITIIEFRSKFYFVIGEVAVPGKYYMRSETTTIRDAVFEAGLPLTSAAMRKCRLITPSPKGNSKTRNVDVYAILYGGNLKRNLVIRSGDVLYVPSTAMAKLFRVIAPVAAPVGAAAGVETGLEEINTRPEPGTQKRVN
jgi:polysaccharide export outer membrane protein